MKYVEGFIKARNPFSGKLVVGIKMGGAPVLKGVGDVAPAREIDMGISRKPEGNGRSPMRVPTEWGLRHGGREGAPMREIDMGISHNPGGSGGSPAREGWGDAPARKPSGSAPARDDVDFGIEKDLWFAPVLEGVRN